MKKLLVLTLIASSLFACKEEAKQENNTETTAKTETMNVKEMALAAQDVLFKDFDAEAAKNYFNEDYIQHNPGVPTGLAPVLGFLPVLKDAGMSVKTHRVLVDGDYVVLHNQYNNAQAFGAEQLVGFDVWRIENGKIAEHWDNLTPLVAETASGRSQVDGPTEVVDLDKTEANKTLVSNMMDDVFFGKAPEKITEYISTEQYDQHNPGVKDGLAGLNEALTALAKANNPFVYKKVHKVIGEGNFVLTMSEGEWNQEPTAFYDLFRIQDGKIVEHWDAIAAIPAEMAHANGKF